MDVCEHIVFLCAHLFACLCELMVIYIFEFAYVALCLFMPVCLCTHTPLVCLSAPVTLFVCLWSVLEWNMNILPLS